MKWLPTPKVKLYEALGCIADGRVIIDGNNGKVYSSSGNKFYTINWDGENSIMSNDNSSYYANYLGYPVIAFLMLKGKIGYDKKFTEMLKGIAWKDLNQKFKNDFEKAVENILETLKEKGYNIDELNAEVDRIYVEVKKLKMTHLGPKTKPPEGY